LSILLVNANLDIKVNFDLILFVSGQKVHSINT